jgi:hypothetical protein
VTRDQYVRLSARTESPPHVFRKSILRSETVIRCLHAAMGMCTEAEELRTSPAAHYWRGGAVARNEMWNLVEEIGDWAWYAAIIARAYRVGLPDALAERSSRPPLDRLDSASAKCLDLMKKVTFYGKSLVEVETGIIQATYDGFRACHDLLAPTGWTMEDALDANLKKLARRYPEKFDPGNAETRDLGAELEAIRESLQ